MLIKWNRDIETVTYDEIRVGETFICLEDGELRLVYLMLADRTAINLETACRVTFNGFNGGGPFQIVTCTLLVEEIVL